MNQWNQHTLFRLLLMFALGILLNTGMHDYIRIHPAVLVLVLLAIFLVQYFTSKFSLYRIRWLAGMFAAAFMFLFGMEWSRLNDHRNYPKHISHLYERGETVVVRLKTPPENRPNSYRVLAEVQAVEKEENWVEARGLVLLYFSKDSLAARLSYGDKIIVFSSLNTPSPPANPGEFDYKRYLANKNIHHQAFVREGDWAALGKGYTNKAVQYAYGLRNTFIRIFENKGLTGKDFAVATALILGMSDFLDNDTRKEFSSAGAMHVLCVSGLHVGIIVMVLSKMLFFLNRSSRIRLLRSILLLAGIWFYALLTGLSPSVLRASAMFSFVVIGMNINRRASIYNSLAGSAFVLLLAEPFLIHEIGFQLSYIAVIAIVSIQPAIYKTWKPDNKILDNLWAIITVSIAAQIGTGPLGLYYFNQFPNYFIITNIIVIPLASLILYSGFLTAILSFIPVAGDIMAWILALLLKFLNGSVSFVDGLPMSATTGITISFIEMLIMFGIIFLVFRSFMLRNRLFLMISLMLLITLGGFSIAKQHRMLHNRQLVVYAINNDVAIDLIKGKNTVMLVDSSRINNLGALDFQTAGYRVRCGVEQISPIAFNGESMSAYLQSRQMEFAMHHPFFQFGGITVMLVDGNTRVPAGTDSLAIRPELMIITGHHRRADVLIEKIKPSKVVITNKVPVWSVARWVEACGKSGISYHNIREQGAFVMKL